MTQSSSLMKEGSLLGCILLIAGSSIGAGMLAMPVVTGLGGFFPSIVMFCLAWLFMTTTGLLLADVNLCLGHQLSFTSLAQKTLGSGGRVLTWGLFVFLFYSLNVAYIGASGTILQSILLDLFGLSVASWVCSAFFTLLFGIVILIGTRHVDYFNRGLMIGLLASYCALVGLGSLYVQPLFLKFTQWKYAFTALPVLVIAFGFHNMVPTLAHYLQGNRKRMHAAIWWGGGLTLVIYILWQTIMLGIIPVEGRAGLACALDQEQVVTDALRRIVGKSWINSVAQCFALFAIITSFLAQSLSLVDFLADALHTSKKGWSRFFLVLIALLPPFFFAFAYPGVFIHALHLAGGIAAAALFGMLPALMVWVLKRQGKMRRSLVVPAVVFLCACALFFFEIAQEWGWCPSRPPTAEVTHAGHV